MHNLDFTSILPTEVILAIFILVDVDTLDHCCSVSRQWYALTRPVRVNRGPKHVRLNFEIVSTDATETSEVRHLEHWLRLNDGFQVFEHIIQDLYTDLNLDHLICYEESFDNSVEADLIRLLRSRKRSSFMLRLVVSKAGNKAWTWLGRITILLTSSHENKVCANSGCLVRISTWNPQ